MGWGFENYCYLCSPFIGSGGGIGRHAGLKIPWAEMPVRVRFPSRAPMKHAEIAQLVEHDLAKVGVASSSLVFRSKGFRNIRDPFCVEARTSDPVPPP